MNKKQRVIRDLENHNCLKVISGIDNFDIERVLKIANAAENMSATIVDISADENIINEVLSICEDTAVMVSSVEPSELIHAQELGADVLELGNFEALYEKGIFYSAEEVYDLARKIMEAREDALVSITIPGHLEVKEQVELAEKLEELGVDILQTEGASLVDASSPSALGQIEKVRLTLANTIEISKVVEDAYIITASGISPDTARLAFAAGAHGIGVGKYINKLESELEMLSAIKALKEAVANQVSPVA